jgi:L-alanine-DL-glutamate epimerase-like enolase superfamily enzyme
MTPEERTAAGAIVPPPRLPVDMAISLEAVEWRLLTVPLDPPIFLGNVRISERQYLWVCVHDAQGRSGCSYGFTRNLPLEAIMEPIARCALFADEGDLTGFALAVHHRFRFAGTNGVIDRARSLVDLAIWDLCGQICGQPVWRLLGGPQGVVNVVAVVGYQREGDGEDALCREIEEIETAGWYAIKIMTGMDSPQRDVEFVAKALRGCRGDTPIWLDVNGSWTPGPQARWAVVELQRLGVAVIEEPYPPSAPLSALCELRAAGGVQLAVGEFDNDPRVLLAYADSGVEVIRCDATVVGGVETWLAIAAHVAKRGSLVFPHFFPEPHAHLVAAIPNGYAVELVPDWTTGLSSLARWPARHEGKQLMLPDASGFGIEWDLEAIERYTIRYGIVTQGS